MEYYYIYDIALLICIAVPVLLGVKRGFIKTVISAAVYLTAVLGSGFIADRYAEPVYMEYFHDKVVSVTEEKLEDMRSDIVERIKSTIESVIGGDIFSYVNEDEKSTEYETDENLFSEYLTNPQIRGKLDSEIENYILMLAENLKGSVPDMLCSALREHSKDTAAADLIIGNDMSGAAEYIELNILRPPLVRSVWYALLSISFVVISTVGKIITYILCSMKTFDTVRTADRLLGGIAGLAVGIVMTVVFTAAVRFIISVTSGEFSFFTENSVEMSVIYRYIYNLIKI